jgi:hypothetical protein
LHFDWRRRSLDRSRSWWDDSFGFKDRSGFVIKDKLLNEIINPERKKKTKSKS